MWYLPYSWARCFIYTNYLIENDYTYPIESVTEQIVSHSEIVGPCSVLFLTSSRE